MKRIDIRQRLAQIEEDERQERQAFIADLTKGVVSLFAISAFIFVIGVYAPELGSVQ